MKLLELSVKKYRALNNLTINFNRDSNPSGPVTQNNYTLDFLAGVNGTGKSTVLRLLGRLFAQLTTTTFEFPIPITLKYRIGNKHITVSNMDDDDPDIPATDQLRFKRDDGLWSDNKLT